jgi:hypothetical protein
VWCEGVWCEVADGRGVGGGVVGGSRASHLNRDDPISSSEMVSAGRGVKRGV